MPPSPATIARDHRSLAGHAAGATIPDLAIGEEIDPAVVRRVLRAAGVTPGPLRKPSADRASDCLADPAWLRAEYATKRGKQIAKELGCSHDRVYEALHAAGIPMRENGFYPKPQDRITPEVIDRIVSLYLAGSPAERVAGELGLPVKAVNRLVEQREVKRTRSEVTSLAHAERLKSEAMARNEWPAKLQAEILDRYAQGQSGEMISELLELPASSVYRLLRDRGVLRSKGAAKRIHKRGRPQVEVEPGVTEILPAELAQEAVERYAAGESPRLIGLALGVPSSRVYRVLKQWGVLRSKSEARKVAHARRRATGEQDPANFGPTEVETEVVERYAASDC